MKRACLYLVIFGAAFGLGVFTSGPAPKLLRAYVNARSVDDVLLRTARISIYSLTGKQRFTESYRACGYGYVQGYVTDDGIEVREGSIGCIQLPSIGNTGFSDGNSRVPVRGISQTAERAVLEFNEDGRQTFEIEELSDGACTHFVSAPTLELALEFEEFLKNPTK